MTTDTIKRFLTYVIEDSTIEVDKKVDIIFDLFCSSDDDNKNEKDLERIEDVFNRNTGV
jgi:hypothetical protein